MEYIITYVIVINLIAFLAMYIDKKKAQKGKWRIKESTLFTLVFLGGGIGGIAGTEQAKIRNCFSKGNVTGESTIQVGGIIGNTIENGKSYIENNFKEIYILGR